ncbi:MAG TPA: DUF6279 family lipoprotein [Burkholderiales bacterium]|nr:DUF6279 family lipoprotein [Burkholderiales bacterium]
MRRLHFLPAAVLCLVLLSGCTLLRLGYGQIDHFAEWTADEYFDLGPEQKDEFRKRFQRLHAWHRYDQLPDYARFLTSVSTRIREGLEQQDAMWIGSGIEERYRALVARSADDAAALLMTITPGQLEALQRKWDRQNSRFMREHRVTGTPEQQQRARVEREIERIEEWAGDVSGEQKKKIAELSRSVPLALRLRYEDRLRRQRGFMQLMEQRGDPREFASRLRHFLLNWEEGRAPEYRRVYAEWREKQAGFYLEVVRMLTERQRATLLQRVQRYTDDFTRLAQRDGSGTGSGSSPRAVTGER